MRRASNGAGPSSDGALAAPPKTRLVLFYAVLALATAAGVIAILLAGRHEHAQKTIAGGYDVGRGASCMGAQFDLKQSGQFVDVANARGTLAGKLRWRDGRLRGEVSCAGPGSARLDAAVRGRLLVGTIGGRPLAAALRRSPPPPGSPKPRAPGGISGKYALTPQSDCLGSSLVLKNAHGALTVVAGSSPVGSVSYQGGVLTGRVKCQLGAAAVVTGQAVDRQLRLVLMPRGGPPERVTATEQRDFSNGVAAFFIAVVVVMLVARALGAVATRVSQPRVMGEVIAGIVLGPTLLGAIAPGLQAAIFPSDIVPFIGVVANLGLIFYMFLVGLEFDPRQLRGRIGQAAAISNASVALPLLLGMAVALPIYKLVGPDKKFIAFALFMGVAMSITAFPVLARILVERRMIKRPVGALALACAAIDDVTAWFLIAIATAVATAGGAGGVGKTVALAIAFCLVMGLAIRPLLRRLSTAYDEAGHVPGGWIAAIFAGVLLSAYATEEIGIALIFGAFVAGLVMPRHAGLTEDVTRRIEDFVVTLLLPLFFAYTGLRTNIGLLDRGILVWLTLALIGIAIVGKLFGAMAAARVTGFGWRPAGVIGTLMNTRGLTELIVLNLALEKGVISDALFAMLVLMAIVTTLMAGPLLKLIDSRNEFGAPVEEELDEARIASTSDYPALEIPERSILVAPQADDSAEFLYDLAESLAHSQPPREVIVAKLVRPPRGADLRGGLQTENMRLAAASRAVHDVRDRLIGRGVAARAVAFVSPAPGRDLARLTTSEPVDLLLLDGRRPLLGEGVPRGDVGDVLLEAACDVAVLVAREADDLAATAARGVLVPFGGADHDWAALELAAWISVTTGAPLTMLGATGQVDERARVTRLLGDAALILQQYAAVPSTPVIAEPGREGILAAAADTGLLVLGLSERWREEGLGAMRSEIARAAPAPVLFVRRGVRAGALAPRDNVTRFAWSVAMPGELPPTPV